MKVVILCGGMGTRLKEETVYIPKPMVLIGNRPILWHIMKIYSHYGFNDFVICLGYKGNMIKEYFYNYDMINNDFTIQLNSEKKIDIHRNDNYEDWKVTLVDTGEFALKGARIKKIEKYIDSDDFLLTYGDGIADINVDKLVRFHKEQKGLVTITSVTGSSLFGKLKIEGSNVASFIEKPESNKELINGGFFVINKQLFSSLSENNDCDFESNVLEKMAIKGQIKAYKHKGFWACMDNPRDRDRLNYLYNQNNAKWKIWK
jgi:glucose-1-phosphate cytidylyltransferase